MNTTNEKESGPATVGNRPAETLQGVKEEKPLQGMAILRLVCKRCGSTDWDSPRLRCRVCGRALPLRLVL